jgi:hypothetical protein
MKRTITISVDQLYRPSPGGIATYVRGLAAGLAIDLDVLVAEQIRGVCHCSLLPWAGSMYTPIR